MSNRGKYVAGRAFGADVKKEADRWTLVLIRTLNHSPAAVWEALTDPAQLREWAPFDSDRNLAAVGPAKLTTVGAPALHVTEGTVKRVEAQKLLEFTWGGNEMRWELAPQSGGTRLTLWHNIGRKFVAMGAAGWHICFDVLGEFLDGHPIGRIVGPDALKVDDWQRLNAEYSQQFGVETVNPPFQSTKPKSP